MQTVCSTTANIIMPQVRQLHRWRRQWQRRYLVSVVYESWPTFSALHYIFAGTVESITRLQECQQCQSWIQELWCYDFTVGYELRSFISKVRCIHPTASEQSSPTRSPYDSDDWVCDCGCADVDQSSRKSDDLTGPTCPAPSLYDSNTNDEDDSDEDDNYDSDGFPLSRRATSLDDIVTWGQYVLLLHSMIATPLMTTPAVMPRHSGLWASIYLRTLSSSSSSSSRRTIQH